MLELNEWAAHEWQSRHARYHGRDGYAQHEDKPQIVELPAQKMAVVRTVGDPERVIHLILPALYSSVYRLNRDLTSAGRDFRIGHLRVRWPDAHVLPASQSHAIWGIPIPEDTVSLPQTSPHIAVEIETWEYGTVAQVTHKGPRSEETIDIDRLKAFIAESGCEIDGGIEEEYLAGPEVAILKTVIRYPIRGRKLLTALGPVREHSLVVVGAGR